MERELGTQWAGLPRLLLAAATVAGLAVGAANPAHAGKSPGFVDGSSLVDLFGDDAVRVEISIPGTLIRPLSKVDPELHRIAGGLDSIQAVILELDECDNERLDQARVRVREIDRGLSADGWERLARIRDAESEVKVLVLNDEDAILGLVVLVIDLDGCELIFANIAGTLDLAAIAQLGEAFGVPGLDQIPDRESAGEKPGRGPKED